MNKNLSLAIEKAVEKINPKDKFPLEKIKTEKKPDLFLLVLLYFFQLILSKLHQVFKYLETKA